MSTGRPDTPAWPALYDPFIDLLRIPHRDPIQPGGHYLYNANDIFRFTLYWTLIFYLPIFVLSGVLASANIAFAPKLRRQASSSKSYAEEGVLAHDRHEAYPLAPLNKTNSTATPASPTSPAFPASSSPPSPSGTAFGAKIGGLSPGPDSGPGYSAGAGPPARVSTSTSTTSQQKVQAQLNNPHRTRAVYALLVLLTYLVAGFLGAVVGSIIVGYVLAGLYKLFADVPASFPASGLLD
ncbi:hypothetical protein A7U60_g7506 [Sanghuangporus baumii]|uniref:Uncharacterized protein n=1 Tax=Sanghuangporus baumii TaxID=108892 RepID=A0A9Q5HT38_SANBA|nr:hypothetical protein A7U60_g7506 [Sanghuangporus baumii]